jgi:predicted MPP superfamily phosphohydrolase
MPRTGIRALHAGSHPLRLFLRRPGKRRLWLAQTLARYGMGQPRLEVKRVEVSVTNLPPALNGFCIAQASDLHVGEGAWGPSQLSVAAQAIRQAHPDVIVITGDFVCGHPPLGRVVAAIEDLLSAGDAAKQVPGLAVFGNHDHYAGEEMVEGLAERLGELGVRVLANEAVCVERDGGGVSFVGLSAYVPGFEAGLEALCATGRPRVALVHEPDLVERLPHDAADLALSGHTHGGQILIPGLKGPVVHAFCGSRYLDGMYRVNGTPLYVNRGLGNAGLPLRVRARPEVTLIRLVH